MKFFTLKHVPWIAIGAAIMELLVEVITEILEIVSKWQ